MVEPGIQRGQESMSAIDGICFDVGGVLLTMDYEIMQRNVSELTDGPTPSLVDFERADWKARVELDEHLRNTTTESSSTRNRYLDRIWHHAWQGCGVAANENALFQSWVQSIEAIHQKINLWHRPGPGGIDAVRKLKAQGLTLGVVSNADGRIEALLAELGYGGLFDVVLDSAIEGIEKPDPEIFHRALDRLGLNARRTIFVGDFYSIDVVGARRAGLGAVLMDPGNNWSVRDVPRIVSLEDLNDRLDEILDGPPSPWA